MFVCRTWIFVLGLLLLTAMATGCAAPAAGQLTMPSLDGAEKIAAPMHTGMTVEEITGLEEAVTPFQFKLKQTIDGRLAAGLPAPSSVTFEYHVTPDQELDVESSDDIARIIQITGKTILHFDGPQEAGYEQWPALVVKDTLPPDAQGFVLAGDYTEIYRNGLAEEFPGIWEQVEFGQEPRTHTIEETFAVSYPGEVEADAASTSSAGTASIEPILMGLTYAGPKIDYTIGDTLAVWNFTVYDVKVGVSLDWALALRLPAEVILAGPEEMVQGSPYTFSSTLLPQDWSEQDFVNAGVTGEAGNELVVRLGYFLGVKAIIVDINVCPGCYVEADLDRSSSFATPFGPDAYLPLPQFEIAIRDRQLGFAVANVGLLITPRIGSTRITAEWQHMLGSECADSGQITYSAPGVPVSFGPVTICDTDSTSDAAMQLTEFRYWLDQFLLGLSANLDTELFGYEVWSGSPIAVELNLSPLSGFLSLGAHKECSWNFECQVSGTYDSVGLSYLGE